MSRDRAGNRGPRPAAKPEDGAGPVALVTGANRGLGREVCRQLADRGYTVALTARDHAKAAGAAGEIDRTGNRVLAGQLDVSDSASVRAMSGWLAATFGRCEVLVNNAAVDCDIDARAVTADLQRVRRAKPTCSGLGPSPRLSCRCCAEVPTHESSMSPAKAAPSAR